MADKAHSHGHSKCIIYFLFGGLLHLQKFYLAQVVRQKRDNLCIDLFSAIGLRSQHCIISDGYSRGHPGIAIAAIVNATIQPG